MAERLPEGAEVLRDAPLRPYTTLKAGGPARELVIARDVDTLAAVATISQKSRMPAIYLGMGSNVLPSDDGIPGRVVLNRASRITVDRSGEIVADVGCAFQELFLKAAQASLTGLEFAVGIPGSLGGAIVSNAGAYRSNIADLLVEIEIAEEGERSWVSTSRMEFGYRDSILRRPNPPPLALLRARLQLRPGVAKEIYDQARDFQRQRIAKQPPPASAGSFFKNVEDRGLAESIEGLPEKLKQAGVVPAGFLIEQCGLKGYAEGGAMFGPRHANFIVNVGGASAFAIRRLAEKAKRQVLERFGVLLEEEVLYLGDWERFFAEERSTS